MSRLIQYLFGIGFVFLLPMLGWNAKLRQELEAERSRAASLDTQVQALTDRLRAAENQLDQEKRKNQQELGAELSKIVDLKNKLSAQRDLANQAKQKLEDAKSNARSPDEPATLRDNLRQEKAYVDELKQRLQIFHQQETQLGSQAKNAQQQQKWQKAEADSSLTAQIQAQQQIVQSTTQKLSQFRGRRDYLGIQEYQSLQAQLKAEQATLQQLKDQKKSVDQQWKDRSTATTNGAQSEKQQIRESEGELRQALQQEQARYQSMQRQLEDAQKSQQSRQDQIKALQADYQAQESKAQELESQLNEAQRSFQQIAH